MSVLQIPPVSRTTLALYAGASGDHNPMHIDIDFAHAAGERDVFAHGMLVMAYMMRCLTDVIPQEDIESVDIRFLAITRVGDALRCTVTVEDVEENVLKVGLSALDQQGETKLRGEALARRHRTAKGEM